MNIADQFKNVNWQDLPNAPPAPKMLALVLLLIAVVGAGFYFYWMPLQEDLDRVKQEEEKLKKDYLDKKRQAINLPELKKQLVQVGQYVATLEKQLPSKSEMDALLTDINQAGLGRGLQFELFRPGGIVMRDYYAEQPISIKVSGRYHDIGAFTADVSNLSRIVTLHDLAIAVPGISSNASTPPRTDTNAVLSMEATARTYRYLDPAEVEEQRKAVAAAEKKK